MALSGALLADFSSFTTACAQAEVSLKGFESGSEKVAGQLDRTSNSLSGVRIVQQATIAAEAVDRIGGVSKLTEKELARVSAIAAEASAKLRAMGQDVPPGIANIAAHAKTAATNLDSLKSVATGLAGAFGVAFSVGAAVQFGKALIDDAGALVDMSVKTGNSIEQLQRYAFVGSQAKVTTEDLAQASFKLGIALDGGEKSAVHAVERLGLNFQKLRAMSPDDQFNATIKALEGVTNEQERNRIGVELFGKSFATIAPAVAKGYTDMAAAATVSSTEQIKAIDDASDAWDRFYAKQKIGLTSWLGNAVLAQGQISKLNEKQLAEYHALTAAADFAGAQKFLLDLAAQHDILLPKQEKTISLTKEQQIEADKLAAAMVELNSVGLGWQGTLDTIDGSVVAAIGYYLDAGVAQDKLATAYGLTAAQIAAVASQLKDEQAGFKLEAKSLLELTKLQQEYAVTAIERSGTTSEVEIAHINATFTVLRAELQKSGAYNAAVAEQLERDWKQALDGVGVDFGALRTHSIEHLQDVADSAQKTFDAMQSDGLHHSQAQIQYFRDIRDAERAALHETDAEHARTFAHMRDDVDRTSFAYRAWLANAATDAERAALGMMKLCKAVDENAKSVHTLAGEWITAANAREKFSAGSTLDVAHAARDPEIAALLHAGWSLENAEAIKFGRQWGFQPKLYSPSGAPETAPDPGERVPGYLAGGPTNEGPAYLHADEYVVPKAGALVLQGGGHGAGGAGPNAITVQLHVSGMLLSNSPAGRAEFADFISDAVTHQLTAKGWRPPNGAWR